MLILNPRSLRKIGLQHQQEITAMGNGLSFGLQGSFKTPGTEGNLAWDGAVTRAGEYDHLEGVPDATLRPDRGRKSVHHRSLDATGPTAVFRGS